MAVQTVAAPPRTLRPAPDTAPAPVDDPGGSAPDDGPDARFRWWQPGWPLTYLLTGYPLWWLFGLTQIFLVLAAVIMGVHLARTHRVKARAGFGWWLLFLMWVAVGVLLLQVDAAGAQPGASNGRYVTFTYRCCLYLAATIVLLYVYNFRSRIPTLRIVRAFGWFFVTVVAGGVLGALAPNLNFPSAMELVLPHGLTRVPFVHTLVHPGVAQFFNTENLTGTPRTSAPFTYTNDWGLSFGCLLPFFLIAWFGAQAGRRRYIAPWILVVAVYPVVVSQNRGLWIALVVSGLIVIVRSAVFGRIKLAITALLGAALAVAVVLSTPLGATISDRLTNAGSEGGRATLGTETLKSVAQTSPVVGLGTTRNVQGTFYSIAGGDSVNCVGCAPPPLGTQGHFWLVSFSTGYGGLLLYLGFIVLQLLRHIRLRSPIGTLGVVVIVVHLSTMLIYDTIGIELFIIFAAIGLLWREKADTPAARTGWVAPDPTIAAYTGLLRRNVAVVAGCALLGVAGGLVYQHGQGIQHEAVTSVVVPVDPAPPVEGGTGLTVDTIAKLIGSPAVRDAVTRIVGTPLTPGGSHLYVTAKTNSRVLEVHVVDRRASVAQRAAQAAGAALVASRASVLADQRGDDLRALQRERAAYLEAVAAIDVVHADKSLAKPLAGQRSRLLTEVEVLDNQVVKLETIAIEPGQVLDTPPARAQSSAWLVAACSGLMLGVLLSVLMLAARNAGGRRFRWAAQGYGDLPVLARMTTPVSGTWPGSHAADRAADALSRIGPTTVLSADDSPLGHSAAAALDDAVAQRTDRVGRSRRSPEPVVLVAGPRTTDREFDHTRNGIEACAAPIVGIVLVEDLLVPEGDGLLRRIPWHPTRRLRGKRP